MAAVCSEQYRRLGKEESAFLFLRGVRVGGKSRGIRKGGGPLSGDFIVRAAKIFRKPGDEKPGFAPSPSPRWTHVIALYAAGRLKYE